MIKLWFKSGNPWIWLTAAAVSVCLIMIVGVLLLTALRGVGHFWPHQVVQFSYQENGGPIQTLFAEHIDSSIMSTAMAKASGFQMADGEDSLVQYQLKTGNRDVTGADFRWIEERNVKAQKTPEAIMVVERREWGNFYGQ